MHVPKLNHHKKDISNETIKVFENNKLSSPLNAFFINHAAADTDTGSGCLAGIQLVNTTSQPLAFEVQKLIGSVSTASGTLEPNVPLNLAFTYVPYAGIPAVTKGDIAILVNKIMALGIAYYVEADPSHAGSTMRCTYSMSFDEVSLNETHSTNASNSYYVINISESGQNLQKK